VVFLSPDQRFLTRNLYDINVDPVQLREQQRTVLETELRDGDFPARGPMQARVTITIFADFECPYCKQQIQILAKEKFLEQTGARVVFRNLPIPGHPWAEPAAEMAACAYQQSNDAFWELHDLLFREQSRITTETLNEQVQDILARRSDINPTVYKKCIEQGEGKLEVERDVSFAKNHDISGTPTLFINDIRNDGLASEEELRALIRNASSKLDSKPPKLPTPAP
jgi:protein-disulfide isomerase